MILVSFVIRTVPLIVLVIFNVTVSICIAITALIHINTYLDPWFGVTGRNACFPWPFKGNAVSNWPGDDPTLCRVNIKPYGYNLRFLVLYCDLLPVHVTYMPVLFPWHWYNLLIAAVLVTKCSMALVKYMYEQIHIANITHTPMYLPG